jgi:hypothetical protein
MASFDWLDSDTLELVCPGGGTMQVTEGPNGQAHAVAQFEICNGTEWDNVALVRVHVTAGQAQAIAQALMKFSRAVAPPTPGQGGETAPAGA